tara:strand:+ start:858 stop:1157 length:300 start_codon:yes stop_codon:yes gene_type:complete
MKAQNSPITTSGSRKYKYDKNNRIKTIITTDETGNVSRERISRGDRMKNAQAKNPIYMEEDSKSLKNEPDKPDPKKQMGGIFNNYSEKMKKIRETPKGF